MGSSTNKKVTILRFDREALQGFVNPHSFAQASGVELLGIGGTVSVVPYDEVKVVCFVRDFESAPPALHYRLFTNRPKATGLWVRMQFRDGGEMDAILPNNLLQIELFGYTVSAPGQGAELQKLFIPKAALAELQVVGVVGSPLTKKKRPPKDDQLEMFEG